MRNLISLILMIIIVIISSVSFGYSWGIGKLSKVDAYVFFGLIGLVLIVGFFIALYRRRKELKTENNE
ncbi:LPXTG-motif cell wall-anchored protein [Parabacteroides sp. PF5-9]|nr:LPXTG-motif cell wall-anchored protein [Parabacteroides sp. PF5-9]